MMFKDLTIEAMQFKSSQDWKAQLRLPPADTRYKTEATQNFSRDLLLGEGGFGTVFLGWVNQNTFTPSKRCDGLAVAVKRLNQESLQGHDEWQDFNAKLGDFGLAKSGADIGEIHISSRVMGTYGYVDPLYVSTGRLSVKSDIYSFGVVLLETLTGQKVFDKINRKQKNLVY